MQQMEVLEAGWRVLGASCVRDWQEALDGCGAHDFAHLAEFHQMAEASGQGSPRLYVLREGDCWIALPLLARRLEEVEGLEEWGAGRLDLVSVNGYAGPVGSEGCSEAMIARFQERLKRDVESEGVVSVFSRLNPVLRQAHLVAGLGEVRWFGNTVAMELGIEPEAQWKGMRPTHRQRIRKLRKAGLECREEAAGAGGDEAARAALGEFIEVYLETMRRVGARSEFFLGKRFVEEFFERLGDRAHLLSVRAKREDGGVGEMIAGSVFVESAGIVEYHLAGVRDAWVKSSALKLVLDEARLLGWRFGARWLHLGGGAGSEDSLFEFKAGFSEHRFAVGGWSWVVDAEAYGEAVERAATAWARHGLGPARAGYFPAYRSALPGVVEAGGVGAGGGL